MWSIIDPRSTALDMTSDSFSRICTMGEGVGVEDGGRGSRHPLSSRDVEMSRVARSVLVDDSAVTERSTFDDDSPGEGWTELIVVESASTYGVTTS